ncbi:MAG: 3'-5' exoribonuclease [Rhodobacteraceae bacterium]|nr:3'-5' exoribonuclease [Paracoccaceae bacterium]
MNFVALDVETANADMASICSIGVAVFENGIITTEWYSLVDPQDFFDGLNVSIHGIKENDVRDAPTFRDVFPALCSIVGDRPIVTHMHFDRVAIAQASARYSQQPLTNRWLDSAKVARRTWEECARSGYGLKNLCKMIGYSFRHHNALEDAKACGQVLLAAMKHSGLDLESTFISTHAPIRPSRGVEEKRATANVDGPLYGEVVVFTGSLTIPRKEAEDAAAELGCEIGNAVSRKTTMIVVGDVDVQRLAGHPKTAKHRKAEELISEGQNIRVIREADFRELILFGRQQA